jgi:micrococcal nuclease
MKSKVRSKRQEARIKKKQEARTRRSFSLFVLLLLLLMLSLWIQGCQSPTVPPGMQVKVAQVLSGQTLEVTSTNEPPEMISRVRLVGIDAPDSQQQPWGQAAKQWLAAMVDGKTVLLEFDVQDKDAFGRHLAYVWQEGVLLNEKLVQEGYALWVPRSPNHKYDQRLERAQAWARLMGQGIWDPDRPMRLTPAEFRLQNR